MINIIEHTTFLYVLGLLIFFWSDKVVWTNLVLSLPSFSNRRLWSQRMWQSEYR